MRLSPDVPSRRPPIEEAVRQSSHPHAEVRMGPACGGIAGKAGPCGGQFRARTRNSAFQDRAPYDRVLRMSCACQLS